MPSSVVLQPEQYPKRPPPRADSAPKIPMSQVAEHCTKDDAWVVIRGGVYNITDFIRNHPGWNRGGQTSTVLAITRTLGTDCTEEFEGIHSPGAKALLPLYFIGKVAEEPFPSAPRSDGTLTAMETHRRLAYGDEDRLIVQPLGSLASLHGVVKLKLNPMTTTVSRLRKLLGIVLRSRLGRVPSMEVFVEGRLCEDADALLSHVGVRIVRGVQTCDILVTEAATSETSTRTSLRSP